jgi:hypothetical protein
MISCVAAKNIEKVAMRRINVSYTTLLLLRRRISVAAESSNSTTDESADNGIISACDQPASQNAEVALAPHRLRAPRNKKLADIIREGVVALNQIATYIQNNVQTTKSVFSPPEEDSQPRAKQIAEEHRIFSTAQSCLEAMCRKDASFPLMAGGESIMLLGVRVKPSFSHADLYWSLPYVVLSSPELNEKQREFLKGKMEERVQGAPGRMLIRNINAVLSSYYPPKIRFKEAPPLLVYQVMKELED